MAHRRKKHNNGDFRKRAKGRCALCGGYVHPRDASLDHVRALSQGGYDKRKNLQLAHRDCNSRKGRMSMAEWYTLHGGTTGICRARKPQRRPALHSPAPRLRRGS